MVWLPYQVYQLRVLALCDLTRSLRGVRQGAGILITSRGGSLLMYDVTSRDYLGVPGGGTGAANKSAVWLEPIATNGPA